MDRQAVSEVVRVALAGYRYEPPAAGVTLGVPWPAEKVERRISELKAALVEPYLERFDLRDTYEQVMSQESSFASFWVIAEVGGMVEWFDPATGEFGLALRRDGAGSPVTFGVRGDVVGVFGAM